MVYKRKVKLKDGSVSESKTWFMRFYFKGTLYRESTHQTNKREAEKIQAARKTQLFNESLGVKAPKTTPTLREFIEESFRPFVETHFTEKRKTQEQYLYGIANLLAYEKLASAKLTDLTADRVSGIVAVKLTSRTEGHHDQQAVRSAAPNLEPRRRVG